MWLKVAMTSLTLLVEEVASWVFLMLPAVELRLSEDAEPMEDAMLELELLLAAPDGILGGGGIPVDAATVEVDGWWCPDLLKSIFRKMFEKSILINDSLIITNWLEY